MKGLMNWLENKFAPAMQKITALTWVVVIKDSLIQILPFILAGSLFCVGTILNDYIPGLPSFWTPFGWTMSKISLMVAFLIPFNYCEKKRFRKQRIIAGITGLLLFMMIIEPVIQAEGNVGQGQDLYGAAGMFVAMFAGVIVGLVFGAFAKFSFFKEDSVIPDFVRQWFDALLPIMLTIACGWIVVLVIGLDVVGIVQAVFMPLQATLNHPVGMVLMTFLYCFIYSMGISTWVLTPVAQPVKVAAIAANLALVAAGTATAANLSPFTETYMYCAYMWIGGVGCTLPLVLLMTFACKSQELRALGKACLVPGIFNINEPVVFGAIAWNPLLMVPMWLMGIIIPSFTLIFTKLIPFAPIPRIQFELWYCPYPIGTFIATQGAITAIILVLATFALSAAIWFPFLKAYDNQKVREEQAALKA